MKTQMSLSSSIFTTLGVLTLAAVALTPSLASAEVNVSVGYSSGYHGGPGWNGYGNKGPGPHPGYVYARPQPVVVVTPPPPTRYVYVAPQPQVVVVQQAAPTTTVVTETQTPPPYGSRIGNTARIQSPYSTFQIDTTSPRETVIYDVNTGQPFRIP